MGRRDLMVICDRNRERTTYNICLVVCSLARRVAWFGFRPGAVCARLNGSKPTQKRSHPERCAENFPRNLGNDPQIAIGVRLLRHGIFDAVVPAGYVRLDLFTFPIFTRRNRSAKCSISSW